MGITTVSFNIKRNEEVVLRVSSKKHSKLPPYLALGRVGMSRSGETGVDTVELFKSLSSGATWMFWSLMESISPDTNICMLVSGDLSPSERLKLNRSYKELYEKEVIVRLKKNTYMINPKVILPKFGRYEIISKKWNEVIAEKGEMNNV